MRIVFILFITTLSVTTGCGDDKKEKDKVVTVQQAAGTGGIVLSPEDQAILNAWKPGENKGNDVWKLELL